VFTTLLLTVFHGVFCGDKTYANEMPTSSSLRRFYVCAYVCMYVGFVFACCVSGRRTCQQRLNVPHCFLWQTQLLFGRCKHRCMCVLCICARTRCCLILSHHTQCVCVYITYMCIYTRIYTCIYIYLYIYAQTHTCIYVCLYVHMQVRIYT